MYIGCTFLLYKWAIPSVELPSCAICPPSPITACVRLQHLSHLLPHDFAFLRGGGGCSDWGGWGAFRESPQTSKGALQAAGRWVRWHFSPHKIYYKHSNIHLYLVLLYTSKPIQQRVALGRLVHWGNNIKILAKTSTKLSFISKLPSERSVQSTRCWLYIAKREVPVTSSKCIEVE